MADDEFRLEVHTFPMLDTGIGRELGYANDAEFMAAAQAERDRVLFVLTPEARARFEAAEREAERRFLFGDGGPS